MLKMYYIVCNGIDEDKTYEIKDIPAGEHYFYVVYIKDSSVSNGTDTFSFSVTSHDEELFEYKNNKIITELAPWDGINDGDYATYYDTALDTIKGVFKWNSATGDFDSVI